MGNTLSGGEQQMLAIGRALMTNPRLLILDEATEGLAPLIRDEIWHCLSLLKARGQSVLVIDKNIENLDPHRRPPLHHRAGTGGMERHLGRTDRRAGSAASVSRGLIGSVIPGRAPARTRNLAPLVIFSPDLWMIPDPALRTGPE